MTARRGNRSRSLARLWRLGPARSRGCSPRAPMHPHYRPSARQYAAPLGSPAPWSRIRSAHTLPLAGASLIAGVRIVPCTAASWAGSSHSSRPFGPVRWLPWPGIRPAQRPGGGVACRGPAGPRGRVPVWPSSAPRVGPRAAMRGGGCPHPPRYAKKMPHGGGQRAARPLAGGPRVPLPPLAAFSPAGLSAAIPSRLGCWWWSWAVLASLPRRRGPLHEDAGGGRGSPAPGLLLPRAFSPPGFFLPPPASSLAGRLFPLRLGWLLSFLLSAWRPAVGGPRRPCGRPGIQKVLRLGRTNDRRRDRAEKPYRPPGGWFRALPASLLTLKALPHIGQKRQYSRTG